MSDDIPSSTPDGSLDPFETRTRARVDQLDALTALALRAAGALTARIEEDCELGKPGVAETMAALKDAGRMARQCSALADRIDRTARELARKEADGDQTRRLTRRRRVMQRQIDVGLAVTTSIMTAAGDDREAAERLFEAFDAYEKLEDPADYLSWPTGRLVGRICTALGIDAILTDIPPETLADDEAEFGPYGPAFHSPGVSRCPKCAASAHTAAADSS